jgi:DNA polymerase III sliding clamp (beta) subunit (PCNA family)
MQIQRQELLDALNAVKSAVSKNEILEESTHFIFSEKEVLAYNDQICIMYPLQIGFECSVEASSFYKLISRITDSTIEMELTEQWLKLKTKTTKAELAYNPEAKILELVKEIKLPKNKAWKPMSDSLIQALKLCSFSTSPNASTPYLTCVCVKDDFVLSTDELRISLYRLPEPITKAMLLPSQSIKELAGFNPTHYNHDQDAWALFKNEDGAIYCCRTMSGEYPSETFLGEFDFAGKRIKLPPKLKEALQVTEVLAEGDVQEEKRVDVTIQNGKMLIKASKQDVGWVSKELEIQYKREEAIHFTINPVFLADVISKINKVTIGEDRALFEAGPFKHLVSLFVEAE